MIDQCARDKRGMQGSGQKVQIQPNRTNIRCYRKTGVSCTSTSNRRREFWTSVKSWRLLCTIYTGESGGAGKGQERAIELNENVP